MFVQLFTGWRYRPGVRASLAALGMRLAVSRPGYGLSLQGAGAGILYLTAYAAFRLYGVLPEAPAVVLLIAVSALTVWLAVRNDSQPLAGTRIHLDVPVEIRDTASMVPNTDQE